MPPDPIAAWFEELARLGRRYYVAFYTSARTRDRVAILRHKDRDGLQEWSTRKWQVFPGVPLVVDLHEQARALAVARGRPTHVVVTADGVSLSSNPRPGDEAFPLRDVADWPAPLLLKNERGSCVGQLKSIPDLTDTGGQCP